MNVGALATPLVFVAMVTVAEPLNVPLAPVVGAANVTFTPLTGLLPESFTVACRPVVNAELIAAVCGVPPVAVTPAAGPAVFVRPKLAGVATPEVLAVTV